MFSYSIRLKVLTEGGKDYANVELPYGNDRVGFTVDSIGGRTIHRDGTVIPFTGKPYEKLVEKGRGYKIKAKVFTLPAVEVGSILEYRYKLHYNDAYYSSPDWYVQGDLFIRKAHYSWKPTTQPIDKEGEGLTNRVAWTPVLPAGVKVEEKKLIGSDGSEITLDLNDVPALAKESLMAPPESLSYRVLFYYTGYKTSDEYWKAAGKRWSKAHDKFIGPGKGVNELVEKTVTANESQQDKLRKLYDAVMKVENTDYTRARSSQEEKAAGLKEISSADDVLQRQRGSSDQIAALFVAMARAAGMKAYVMGVADRSRRIFMPGYLSLGQLDDDLAIVVLDGKDVVFDPGERYCDFKHVAWMHTMSGGLRQTDNGTALVGGLMENAATEHVTRIADLELDERGEATGKVTVTYNGDPARYWRQQALRGDETSLNADLKTEMEQELPGGMEVRVTKVRGLVEYTKPLMVDYEVKGAIGSSTGKRLLVQANLFQVNAKPTFPESRREHRVVLHYPVYYQDAVRVKYPPTMSVESVPPAEQARMKDVAGYDVSSKQAPGSVISYRNLQVGEVMFPVKDYAELRGFYNKVEAKDQESLVLVRAATVAATK